jgi:hypothetical protein
MTGSCGGVMGPGFRRGDASGAAIARICFREKSPSPPFRGEREAPNPEGWEGEVGGAANRLVGPPHPALSPRPAGGEDRRASRQTRISRQKFFLDSSRTAPRFRGGDEASVQVCSHRGILNAG